MRRPVSATFHGRDIFAPAAAHLVGGVPLSALGPEVDLSTIERPPDDVIEAALDADIITFTSSSTVTNTLALLDEAQRARLASGPRVVSIGPVTSDTVQSAGLVVAAEAAHHDIPGLIDALVDLGRN